MIHANSLPPSVVKKQIGFVQTNRKRDPDLPIGLTDDDGTLNAIELPQRPETIFIAFDSWRNTETRFIITDQRIIDMLASSGRNLMKEENGKLTQISE